MEETQLKQMGHESPRKEVKVQWAKWLGNDNEWAHRYIRGKSKVNEL